MNKPECSEHRNFNLSYFEFFSDAEKKEKKGLKQIKCNKCGLYIWEDLYYETNPLNRE